jgi:hypothetical protein
MLAVIVQAPSYTIWSPTTETDVTNPSYRILKMSYRVGPSEPQSPFIHSRRLPIYQYHHSIGFDCSKMKARVAS